MARPIILIVDDDESLSNMLAHVLSRRGYDTAVAHNQMMVDEFWQKGLNPDLILLDLMLPKISGQEMLLKIRARTETAMVPVVMLSAVTDVETRASLLHSGADDYLVKPCDIGELTARIGMHLKLSQLRDEKREAEARSVRQAQYLRDIYLIGNMAAHHLNLNQMGKVVREIVVRFGCAGGALYLKNKGAGDEMAFEVVETTFAENGQAAAWALAKNVLATKKRQQKNGYMAVPILHDQTKLGVLVVSLTHSAQIEGETMWQDKIQALETVCMSLATAVANAHLFRDIRQHNQILQRIAAENSRLLRNEKKQRQALELSQKQLLQSEKMAVAGRLAASLAHEINNPLQSIHSCLQLVTQFDLERDQQREYLHMADEEVSRLMTLTTRVRNFTRLSSSQFELIDLQEVMEKVLGLASKHLAHNAMSVEQVWDGEAHQIYAVSDQIVQVFLHIILNAIDATRSKGAEAHLVIGVTAVAEKWIRISFQDNGMGMDSDTKSHIYEPFFTTKETQAGLGLTVSYAIIQQHKGHIEVETEEQRGTKVTVLLPQLQRSLKLSGTAQTQGS